MKTKASVLYQQEGNIQQIFEAVITTFFKKIVPDTSMPDKAILGICEEALGTADYDIFKNTFENKELGKFIVEVTEQLQDLNLMRFEAMQEDVAIAESENPYMMQKDLYDGLDKEFEALVITDNIKNKVADIIKNDIEATEDNLKKDEELKDDLDGIDPDDEEFDDNGLDDDDSFDQDNESEDDMKDEEGEDNKEEKDVAEAAWATIAVSDRELNETDFTHSIESLVKDRALVEVDISTKKSIIIELHNFATSALSIVKGMFTKDFMDEFKRTKYDDIQAKYFAWMMSKGCNQLLNKYIMYVLKIAAGTAVGVFMINTGLGILGVIAAWGFAYVTSRKFLKKALPRTVVSSTLGAGVAVQLQDLMNSAPDEAEKNRIETIRNEFMAKAGVTEMDCSAYRGMTEQQIRGNLSLITESFNTSFTKVLDEVITDVTGGEITEDASGNVREIALMATSVMLVKEIFLEGE